MRSDCFCSPATKRKAAFGKAPKSFAKADLAYDGKLCCLPRLMQRKTWPANRNFPIITMGCAYYFPNGDILKKFQADPAKYAVKEKKTSSEASFGKPAVREACVDHGNERVCGPVIFGRTSPGISRPVGVWRSRRPGDASSLLKTHTKLFPRIYDQRLGRF